MPALALQKTKTTNGQHAWPFVAALLGAALLLTGCFSAKPPDRPTRDRELEQLSHVARRAFERGALPQAMTLYEKALRRARLLDDAREMGNAAYNLGVCAAMTGDNARAREWLQEAERELTRAQANLADVFLVQARVAHWQGRNQEALALAEKVLSHERSVPEATHRVQALLLRGSIACDTGDLATARSIQAEVAQAAQAETDPAVQAGLAQLTGRIQLADHQPAAAAQAFDREAQRWQEARRYVEMSAALARAGSAWQAAGQPAAAAQRFYRAARSSFARGETKQAGPWLAAAATLARAAQDEALLAQVTRLQSEMPATARTPKSP